jgi:hypothetical protein
MNKLGDNLDWSITWLTWFSTQLRNSHPQNNYIRNAQIYDGLQELQWEMDLLILPFHNMCEIQIMLMKFPDLMVWFYFS